jgi:hypothetical protein
VGTLNRTQGGDCCGPHKTKSTFQQKVQFPPPDQPP